ncbi:hypothetical protein [Virgisporangium aurantiacum]|uniref:Clumping factor A n=1 Tax=Virgisporangium aurantiacum TaxID=175570 RepID=A0A8J3Z8L8_9ACTN|nr:hypothetical protein [Virgisporangium aurantiacum]GIJ58402.1 hypothetical protein Vau01_059180 [Virgisporangium aurantiacum]
MTVVSLVLIVGAVVLLGYGLLEGSNAYLVASILTSLVAALALVVGSRRSGRAAVAAAIEAEEEAARSPQRRRNRQDRLVGAGVGDRGGDGGPAADEFDDDDDYAGAARETTLLDVGRRGGVPAQSSGERYGGGYGEQQYDDRYDQFEDDDDDDEFDEEDPSDEPPAQRVSPAEVARVAQLDADVLVIDGRPRYHLPGCVHLLGREHESLPVSEAVELGFTPCGLCEPDSTLLARVRR